MNIPPLTNLRACAKRNNKRRQEAKEIAIFGIWAQLIRIKQMMSTWLGFYMGKKRTKREWQKITLLLADDKKPTSRCNQCMSIVYLAMINDDILIFIIYEYLFNN